MPNKQLKKAEKPKKFVILAFSRLMEEGRAYDKSAFYLPWKYPKKPRKSLLYQWLSSIRWRLLHHNYTICGRALM